MTRLSNTRNMAQKGGLTSPSDSRRNLTLQKKYGITLSQFEMMLELQGGKCGICREFLPGKKKMFVDHCHKTGRVRGILCYTCNHRLLGRGLEDPELHRWAADYLESTFDARFIPL